MPRRGSREPIRSRGMNVAAALGAAMVLFVPDAEAQWCTGPCAVDLEQVGPDVHVTASFACDCDRGAVAVTVERQDGARTEVVAQIDDLPRWGCATFFAPEGTTGGYCVCYQFEETVVDHCVPPGPHTYVATFLSNGSAVGQTFDASIAVPDDVEPCDEEAPESALDGGASSDGGADSSCSVGGVGRSQGGWLGALLVVGLWVGRSRRHGQARRRRAGAAPLRPKGRRSHVREAPYVASVLHPCDLSRDRARVSASAHRTGSLHPSS